MQIQNLKKYQSFTKKQYNAEINCNVLYMVGIVSLSSITFSLICPKNLIFRFFFAKMKIFWLFTKMSNFNSVYRFEDFLTRWSQKCIKCLVRRYFWQFYSPSSFATSWLTFSTSWWIKLPKIAMNPTFYTFLTSAR